MIVLVFFEFFVLVIFIGIISVFGYGVFLWVVFVVVVKFGFICVFVLLNFLVIWWELEFGVFFIDGGLDEIWGDVEYV